MEQSSVKEPVDKFSSPEDELAFLRAEVARREKELLHEQMPSPPHRAPADVIEAHRKISPAAILKENYQIPKQEIKNITLGLAPETHDATMNELLSILHEKGVKNALSIVEALGNPHIQDDFERFLVQYLKHGMEVEGLKKGGPLFKGLHMTLYEISLPQKENEAQKKPTEFITAMEQFYSGMLSVADVENRNGKYFTIELAVQNHNDEFVFYAAIPDDKKNLFEKHILSAYHDAKISEHKDDYNIFNESGASAVSYAVSVGNPIFPLKTHEKLDYDPLNTVLNSFSKIDRDGEGAAIQIIIYPKGNEYVKKYKHALDLINKNVKLEEAIDVPGSIRGHFVRSIKDFFKAHKNTQEEKKIKDELVPIDQQAVENIQEKIGSPIVESIIRIVASSHNQQGAEEILSHLESAFNQFENTHGNKLKFERIKKKRLEHALQAFSFRFFSKNESIPLNLKELATIMHFPSSIMKSAPQLKVARSGSAPAPLDLPHEGLLLGINNFRNTETEVYISPDDRLRHMYVVGQTGTGKTTLLKNMIIQDIKAGRGVCMIDPHGTDIEDVLAAIPPERAEDLIYFDPSHTSRPMGLNMLEYDMRFPEQKTFVVNEMLAIFNKLFDMKTAGGPMFEQYFRNATMLVIDDPSSGNTLLEISRVLAQKSFRELKLSRCKNPLVVQFWKEVADKAGGEASLANMVPYITSKFDIFLSNEIMRPIIAQEKSSFSFRDVMDQKKILLINLAKGRLGDINSHLIGLICVGKILMAALSRVDSLGQNPPFYLYIDEFQNVTTDSISTILSEARKYGLSLIVAHQFVAQLDEKIKNSVFGNIGSIASFRVGAEDAEYLEKQFKPVFSAHDLINLENHNACLKMLVRGVPAKPFNLTTLPPQKGRMEITKTLKELSYLKHGRAREEVETEIIKKYQK